MKFTCKTDNIRKAVMLVEKNASRKANLPILSNILIAAEKGKITLITTNLEIATETWVNGKIDIEGSVAVPAQIINSYLQTISEDTLQLSSQKENLLITTLKSKTLVKGYPVTDFPLLPKVRKDAECVIPALDILYALSRATFAAAASSIRPELSSILFKFLKSSVKIVATDSFRLAEVTIPGSFEGMYGLGHFLLPLMSATELMRLIDTDARDIEIAATKGQIIFTTTSFRMISRLVEGVFPEYERIIPSAFPTHSEVGRDILLQKLRGTSLFVSKLNNVSISVHPEHGEIDLATTNTDTGEYFSSLEGEVIGEPVQLSFNYRYLLDGVQQIRSERVWLGFSGAQGPVLIKNTDTDGYVYIVMPMKV